MGLELNQAKALLATVRDLTSSYDDKQLEARFVLLCAQTLDANKIVVESKEWHSLVESAKQELKFNSKLIEYQLNRFYVLQVSDRDWRLFWRCAGDIWIHKQVNTTWFSANQLQQEVQDHYWASIIVNHPEWSLYNGK